MAVVAGVLVALAGAFAAGRASAPEQVATVEYTDRLVNGVPVGFPGTPRGAGDAAAAYVTSLAASAALAASERQAIVDAVAAPGSGPSVADLVGVPAAQPGGAVISQVLVARVWVPDHDVDAAVPEGGEVSARMLLCALNGAVTDGIVAGSQAGLAGGWYVQDVTLGWVQGRWRVTVAQRPVPVPPPDQRGARRDGSPRDTQPLLEVLSARSWVPGTV
ncbi:hypothetical protein ACFYMB_31540 [Micromonospora haikouensis]|uniref:hypothetical protein n=1 Tax=Micromonospora haikouensis TaxID=686309 RepID=UPI0036C9E556